MNDRRTGPRIPVKVKVDFTSSDSVQNVLALNIGAGGIFLATPRPLPPGSTVVLQVTLPNLDGPVEILGEVVWSNARPNGQTDLPEGMGIRFLNLSSLVKERLGIPSAAGKGSS